MTNDLSSSTSQLSIIVDLTSSRFDLKEFYKNLSQFSLPNYDHHYWHYGGLRSYTIPFRFEDDETNIQGYISELKSIQNYFPLYWISYKEQILLSSISSEVIKKNLKLGRFYANNTFQIECTSGALVQLNEYFYDPQTEIKDGWRLVFYHDRIDIDYGFKENKLRKTLKAEMIDKCVVIMKEQNKLTFFINMNGNLIDYKSLNNDEKINLEQDSKLKNKTQPTIAYIRTAPRESQLFYSTIRLVISFSKDNENEENHIDQLKRLKYCYTQFQEFFQRNHINDCFGNITSTLSRKDLSSIVSLFMNNNTMSFVKQYSWQMLLSIGYRFQQRLTEDFIQQMNLIQDDNEFYQVH